MDNKNDLPSKVRNRHISLFMGLIFASFVVCSFGGNEGLSLVRPPLLAMQGKVEERINFSLNLKLKSFFFLASFSV